LADRLCLGLPPMEFACHPGVIEKTN